MGVSTPKNPLGTDGFANACSLGQVVIRVGRDCEYCSAWVRLPGYWIPI